MAFIIAILITGRLFFWNIFPQYGQGHESEIVFMSFSVAVIAAYLVSKIRSSVRWPIFWLILSMMISFQTSIHYAKSSLFMMNQCLYILLFGMIVKYTVRKEQIIRIIACAFIVAFIISIKAISEIPFITRTYSFIGWPTATASVLLLFIPGSILWASRSFKRWWFPAVLIAAFLSTRSIMPCLSLFVVLSIMFINNYKINILFVLILVGVIIVRNEIVQSFLVRIEYIAEAMKLIVQHPVNGTGAGTFLYQGAAQTRFVHNSYLQAWVELGVIGFISLSTLLGRVFRLHPGKSILEKSLYFGLIAFLIDNITNFTLLKSTTAIYFWVILGCYISLKVRNEEKPA